VPGSQLTQCQYPSLPGPLPGKQALTPWIGHWFGGEDYELLFTVSRGCVGEVVEAFAAAGLSGGCCDRRGDRTLLWTMGRDAGRPAMELTPGGYAHFREGSR